MSIEETFTKLNDGVSGQEAVNILSDWLLGEDWYSVYTNNEDVNAEIVVEILRQNSRKFRRQYKKIKRHK